MRRTTKKLSGIAKDRFLRQWLATEPALPTDVADRLARRGSEAVSSVRVRRLRWPMIKFTPVVRTIATSASKPQPDTPEMPQPTTPAATVATPPPALASAADTPFDPYVFGLVPTVQREGRDGAIVKLVALGDTAKLRQMARAQQIVLAEPLKSGDVTLQELAAGIADAVARRIADRKAAAR